MLPSKYNPSKERPFPNQDCYFEDNFDQVTNISVIVEKSNKGSIDGFGKPEAFLEQIGYLLGVQSYSGQTRSEGGFAANKVSSASVLDVSTRSAKGKTYYEYEILTRTADGDEGGRDDDEGRDPFYELQGIVTLEDVLEELIQAAN